MALVQALTDAPGSAVLAIELAKAAARAHDQRRFQRYVQIAQPFYLARHEAEEYISVDAIATAQSIPPKFLEQILLAMKRAHLLRSTKGQHGGYHLAKPANQISLAEVIRLFDGALAPTSKRNRA